MGVVTEMTNLKERELELEAELRQSSKHVTATKMHEKPVKKRLATAKRELMASRLECAILLLDVMRWFPERKMQNLKRTWRSRQLSLV